MHPFDDNIRIQPAQYKDAEAIAGLIIALNWVHPATAGKSIGARVAGKLSRSLSSRAFSVLVAAGGQSGLVGFVSVNWIPHLLLPAPEGYISELVVDESWRGRGIGSRLLTAAQDEARNRGCGRLMLLNNRGRASYQNGFYTQKGWSERIDVACFNFPLD